MMMLDANLKNMVSPLAAIRTEEYMITITRKNISNYS
jgi:hypothetical protein